MAASRSLNDPVVMVTLVKAWAVPAACPAIVTNRTNGMEKLKSFIFIASSDGLAIVERSDVNEIAQRRQAGVACWSWDRVYLIIFPRRLEKRRESPAPSRRSFAA